MLPFYLKVIWPLHLDRRPTPQFFKYHFFSSYNTPPPLLIPYKQSISGKRCCAYRQNNTRTVKSITSHYMTGIRIYYPLSSINTCQYCDDLLQRKRL